MRKAEIAHTDAFKYLLCSALCTMDSQTTYERRGYGSSGSSDRKFAFHCKNTGLGLDIEEVWHDKTHQYSDINLEVLFSEKNLALFKLHMYI